MGNKIVGAAYDEKAALDLAAAFVRSGLTVEVINGNSYQSCVAQAAVYNLDSFFLTPQQEYQVVRQLFDAVPEETMCFFKTDSSLRGNLGSELRALMDSRKQKSLLFIPALPGAKKFTENGIQYQFIDGKKNYLEDAKKLISSFDETVVVCGDGNTSHEKGIYAANCASQEAFDEMIKKISPVNHRALAGTSALAAKLIDILQLPAMAMICCNGKTGVLNLVSLEWKEEA